MDTTLIVIDSDAELARARALVDRLMASGDPTDLARLAAQARLIAAYEEAKWPRRRPSTAEIIRYLMDQQCHSARLEGQQPDRDCGRDQQEEAGRRGRRTIGLRLVRAVRRSAPVYSITSSARTKIELGTSRPSALGGLEVHGHLELGRQSADIRAIH